MKTLPSRQLAVLILLGIVTSCAAPVPNSASQAAAVPSDTLASRAICRAGRDGGPPVADRGIGGTGAPMVAALTATPLGANQAAERDSGIVGTITGFASICVDGLEVRYDASAAVDVDGTPSSAGMLRAGQVAVIRIGGPVDAQYARTISTRSEAMGWIEAVERNSGLLRIAGQSVSVPPDAWGANRFGRGDWVRVSGLRRRDGVIVASRLDPADANTLMARGQVERRGDVMRVGHLVISHAAAGGVTAGQFVTVTGDYVNGVGNVRAVTLDTAISDPPAFFGEKVDRITVQSFVRVANGVVRMTGFNVPAALGLPVTSGPDRVAVVSLDRGPDGRFAAVGLRYTDMRGREHAGSRKTGNAVKNKAREPSGHATPASPPPAAVSPVPDAASPAHDALPDPVSATPRIDTPPEAVPVTGNNP